MFLVIYTLSKCKVSLLLLRGNKRTHGVKMTLSAVVQSMNCTDNNIFGSVLGKQNNEIMFITLHYTSLEISAGKQISDLILETSKQYLALQSIA